MESDLFKKYFTPLTNVSGGNQGTSSKYGVYGTIDNAFDHLGYSRLASYMECPAKYRYTYIDKLGDMKSTAIRRGQAYHATLECLLNYKMERGQMLGILKAENVAEIYAREEGLTDCEVGRVMDAVRFYHRNLYAQHNPIGVEQGFEITKGGVKLTGKIDLIDSRSDGTLVIDHKFSYDIWPETRAKYGCQPMIYQWWAEQNVENFAGFAYNIVRVFPYPVIQELRIPVIPKAQSDWWEMQVGIVAGAIKAGFFPYNPEEKHCGWCNHKKVCEFSAYTVQETLFGKQAGRKEYEI